MECEAMNNENASYEAYTINVQPRSARHSRDFALSCEVCYYKSFSNKTTQLAKADEPLLDNRRHPQADSPFQISNGKRAKIF
ncbi:hypothetical protein OSTOST_21645 [Ostertagia ostertagi]